MQLRITTCLSVLAVASAAWLPAALAQNGPPRLPLRRLPAAAPAGSSAPAPSAPAADRGSISPGRPGKLYRDLAHQADGGGFSQGVLGLRHQPGLAGAGYPAHAGAGSKSCDRSGQGQWRRRQRSRPRSSAFFTLPDGKFLVADSLLPFGSKPFQAYREILQAGATGPSQGGSLQSARDCRVL